MHAAGRSRILAPGDRPVIYRDRLLRVFLVDGFVAGTWQINGATIHVRPIRALRATDQRSVEEEAERLLAFLLPHESAPDVRIDPPPCNPRAGIARIDGDLPTLTMTPGDMSVNSASSVSQLD